MELDGSILTHIKEAIGLSDDDDSFDIDILTHINASIGDLNQNGVGNIIDVDSETTWRELQNPNQEEGNQYFKMVPSYIALSTKVIFDPPPPSSVQQYVTSIEKILWRLKVAYEVDLV